MSSLLAQLSLALVCWIVSVRHHAHTSAAEEAARWAATESAWRALVSECRRGRVC